MADQLPAVATSGQPSAGHPAARKDAAPKHRIPASAFVKGHSVRKPKGSKDRRRVAGQAVAQGLEAKAWDVVEALLTCRSWRARLESAKVVLGYSIGLPRQTLELTGGFGDLSRELAEALKVARLRHTTLEGALPVAGRLALPPAAPAPPADLHSGGEATNHAASMALPAKQADPGPAPGPGGEISVPAAPSAPPLELDAGTSPMESGPPIDPNAAVADKKPLDLALSGPVAPEKAGEAGEDYFFMEALEASRAKAGGPE